MTARPLPFEPMPTVEVPDARLDVDDAGRGVPLVWGHGLTSSRRVEDDRGLFDWAFVRDAARVVRFDARSHGRSTGSPVVDQHRWSYLAGDMVAVADACAVDRAVFGGASMGAATALFAALAVPDRLEGLVLVIPPTAWETRAAQAGLYEQGAAIVEEHGIDRFLQLVAAAPIPPLFAEEPELARFRPDVGPALLPAVLRGAAASDLPDPAVLSAIGVPTLVLAWAGDPGHPVSTAERLVEAIPTARLEVAPSLAAARAWPERIRGFVAGVAAAE